MFAVLVFLEGSVLSSKEDVQVFVYWLIVSVGVGVNEFLFASKFRYQYFNGCTIVILFEVYLHISGKK